MEELVQIVSVIFISSFKFVAGPTLAYAFDFGFAQTILVTVAGGMVGVFTISYYTPVLVSFWNWISDKWHHLRHRNEPTSVYSKPVADFENPVEVKYEYVSVRLSRDRKVFSNKSRNMVKVWQRWGLFGLAFITPVTISIPVGTFIATRFVSNKKKVLLYMFFSVLFWSVLLSSAFELYHIVNLSELNTLFF